MKESFVLENPSEENEEESFEDRILRLEADKAILQEKVERLEEENERLKEEVASLKEETVKDPLTGLKNRKFLSEAVRKQLNKIVRKKEGVERRSENIEDLCLLFFDVDNFKKVNDAYGHGVGDEVLKKVADVLNSSVRDSDIVSRWGGEEMVVALFGALRGSAISKAESIRKEIEELEFSVSGLKVTVSIGVASSKDFNDFDKLVEEADAAMYNSKQSGKNRVMISLPAGR